MGLMKIENGKVTSLELLKEINFFRSTSSDYKELRHDTLLNIIRDEFEEEIGIQEILETYYVTSQNKKAPLFRLTINQSKQVLVRESKIVRKAVIKRLDELEKIYIQKEKNNFEYNKRVSIDVKKMADSLFTKDKGVLSTVIAEINNTSAIKMNKFLEKSNVIAKVDDGFGWHLKNDFRGRSLAEISNNGKIVRWTTKGTVFINQLYQANSIIYLDPDQMKLF